MRQPGDGSRKHILPGLRSHSLASIRPHTVQAWIADLERQQLATSYIHVLLANLLAILTAAVEDERIVKNPCAASSVRAPKVEPRKVQPWPSSTVDSITSALPDRYRILAVLGAGLGLRQGELFGIGPRGRRSRGWCRHRA